MSSFSRTNGCGAPLVSVGYRLKAASCPTSFFYVWKKEELLAGRADQEEKKVFLNITSEQNRTYISSSTALFMETLQHPAVIQLHAQVWGGDGFASQHGQFQPLNWSAHYRAHFLLHHCLPSVPK